MDFNFAAYISAFTKGLLLVVATILPVVNPPSVTPLFLSLTEGASRDTRRSLARRIARNVTLLLVAFMLVGSFLLDFFGLSIDIVRVGGGLLVAQMGWQLISTNSATTAGKDKLVQAYTPERARTSAFYPLSFPITYGPGSIAASITVGVSLIDRSPMLTMTGVGGACVGALVVGLSIWLCYNYAERLLSRLGENGTIVLLRISAFILLCLGVQIFWSGAENLLTSAFEKGVTGALDAANGFAR